MHKEDPGVRNTQQFCVYNVVRLQLRAHVAPDHPGDTRDEENAECDDNIFLGRAEHTDKNKRQQDARKSKKTVVDAHDDRVKCAPDVAGERADERSENAADRHRHRADQHRGQRTVRHARVHVAAVVVRAEEVLQGRGKIFRGRIHLIRPVGRQKQAPRDQQNRQEEKRAAAYEIERMLPLHLVPFRRTGRLLSPQTKLYFP